jgi:D-glycero-alpha-D-manno-heptose-7-phosphate kinase
MVLVKTPLRMSFFGGGTDHPIWFKENGGSVLSTTVDKYIYLQIRQIYKIFDYNYRILWSIVECANKTSEIKHPVVRTVLENFWANKSGLEIVYNADLPARSGLGSSSAFTVAILQGLWAEMGKILSKHELAILAIKIEHELLKETVGYQDQIAAAYGGFNKIQFNKNGTFNVLPLIMSHERQEELENKLMLFFTGFTRDASSIELEKMSDLSGKEKYLQRLNDMVNEAENILLNTNINLNELGALFNEAWVTKKALSNLVSNIKIDDIYSKAMKAGALGGKLLGAGGGGFLLLFVENENQEKVKVALSAVTHVPIKFELNGSKIVMYERSVTN